MNLDDLPLSLFEVDCDGSACGSNAPNHVHPRQDSEAPLGRIAVRNGKRTLQLIDGEACGNGS